MFWGQGPGKGLAGTCEAPKATGLRSRFPTNPAAERLVPSGSVHPVMAKVAATRPGKVWDGDPSRWGQPQLEPRPSQGCPWIRPSTFPAPDPGLACSVSSLGDTECPCSFRKPVCPWKPHHVGSSVYWACTPTPRTHMYGGWNMGSERGQEVGICSGAPEMHKGTHDLVPCSEAIWADWGAAL